MRPGARVILAAMTLTLAALAGVPPVQAQTASGAVRVEVRASGQPVPDADVSIGEIARRTDAEGVTTIPVPPGQVTVSVTRAGFAPASATLDVSAGASRTVVVELQPEPAIEESVTVVATTRTGRRLEDQPMRVEVLAREEIEEKMLMTPGDIVMMLNEMGGMRVQATSPSLGAASVRIQGMRGRYTRVSVRRAAAVRRSRRARPAADPADGSRAGRGHQGRRLVAVRRRRDGRRRQPDLAPAGRRAPSASSWSTARRAARPTRSRFLSGPLRARLGGVDARRRPLAGGRGRER